MMTLASERIGGSKAHGCRGLRTTTARLASSSSSRPMPKTPQLAHTRAGFKVPGMQETLGALAAEPPLPSSSSSAPHHRHDRELPKTPQSAMRQYLFVEKERLSSSQPTAQPRRKNQGSSSLSSVVAAAAPPPPWAPQAPATAGAVPLKKKSGSKHAKRGGGGMFDGAGYRVRPLARGLYG